MVFNVSYLSKVIKKIRMFDLVNNFYPDFVPDWKPAEEFPHLRGGKKVFCGCLLSQMQKHGSDFTQ